MYVYIVHVPTDVLRGWVFHPVLSDPLTLGEDVTARRSASF